MIYEWDPAKAAANLRKHRVNFAEAASVFLDPMELTFADPDLLLTPGGAGPQRPTVHSLRRAGLAEKGPFMFPTLKDRWF